MIFFILEKSCILTLIFQKLKIKQLNLFIIIIYKVYFYNNICLYISKKIKLLLISFIF